MREIIGGDNSTTAGYRRGHVTSIHAKYIRPRPPHIVSVGLHAGNVLSDEVIALLPQ